MNKYLCAWILLFSSVANSAPPAQRIIALSPHAVEMLYAIGAGEQIVATTEYADHPEQAQTIPRIGGYHGIQLDRVIELQPDLIVVWRNGNQPGDIAQLTKLGYPIYQSEPKDLAGIADEIEQLGELTGHQREAKKIAKEFRQRLENIRTAYQDQEKISVFYQLWSSPLMSISRHSWVHQMIATCGGSNVMADAATDYPQVSLEQVLLLTPQVIIQPEEHSNPNGNSYEWHRWPELPAVKHQQIFTINVDLLHRFSPRALDGLQQMCDALMSARQAYQASK